MIKGEKLKGECKRGLPGHRCPLLIKGESYEFRVDKFEFYFSIFNHIKIVVFWLNNGKNGTYFNRIDFKTFFHPKEKLEDFLIKAESDKYNL